MDKLLIQVLFLVLTLSICLSAGISAATTIPAGVGPWAVAVNPVTNKVYVANHLTSVTVIEGTSATPVATGYGPHAVAVNPVTNKIYVTNDITDDVTVIDGATNNPSPVKDTTASKPYGVAVNTVTDKIYVANYGSNTVTVIDGPTNILTTVKDTNPTKPASQPYGVAVNPVTNKVYVANNGSSTVTVIDGTDNSVLATIIVDSNPQAVAVNPVTNKVYVVNYTSGTVSVINGANDTVSSTVAVGSFPKAVAINPVTNRIYIVNYGTTGTVKVIDGTTDSVLTTVIAGSNSQALTVNPVSNKVYVVNTIGNSVTVIEGTAYLKTIDVGISPVAVAVNMITNEVYVANKDSQDVTVIAETPVPPSPLTTSISPLPGDTTSSTTPTFAMTATSSTGSSVRNIYYQVDSVQGVWLAAVPAGASGSGTTPLLAPGNHVIHAFAADGSDASSINTGSQSSPLTGAIASYSFTVSGLPPPVTYTVTPMNTAHGSISPNTPQVVTPGAFVDFLVTPDNGYRIVSVTGNGCSVTMIGSGSLINPTTYRAGPVTANCEVTPTFSTDLLPVRIGSVYYQNLVDAYTLAPSGAVIIQAMATSFSGDLNLNRADIALTLEGGYDVTYATRTGNTVMIGKLTIGAGNLVADRLTIQ
jgi:YVTN family beta-propeller protein